MKIGDRVILINNEIDKVKYYDNANIKGSGLNNKLYKIYIINMVCSDEIINLKNVPFTFMKIRFKLLKDYRKEKLKNILL